MYERIGYRSPESNEFQKKPHVAIVEYDLGKWTVDLRWREDSNSARIDAQYNFAKNLSIDDAIIQGVSLGIILNIPVAQYEENNMHILCQQKIMTAEQQKVLQILVQNEKAERFNTH